MTSRNSGSLYFKCFHCKHILFGRLEVQLQLFSVTKKARALKSWLIFNPVITLETPTVRCSVQTALFKQHTQPLISPERLILHFFPSTITSHVRPHMQTQSKNTVLRYGASHSLLSIVLETVAHVSVSGCSVTGAANLSTFSIKSPMQIASGHNANCSLWSHSGWRVSCLLIKQTSTHCPQAGG